MGWEDERGEVLWGAHLATDLKNGHIVGYEHWVYTMPSLGKRFTAYIITEDSGQTCQPDNVSALIRVQDWSNHQQCWQAGQSAVHTVQATCHWDFCGWNLFTRRKSIKAKQTWVDHLLFGTSLIETQHQVQGLIHSHDDSPFEKNCARTTLDWKES